MDLISIQNLRLDGRKPNELRNISIKSTIASNSTGSCLYSHGNNKVLVTVLGPIESAPSASSQFVSSKADQLHVGKLNLIISCNSNFNPNDLELYIKSTFSPLLPPFNINCHIQILQHDGSVLACCINALTLALVDANIPLFELPIACSVSSYNNVTLLDVNKLEEDLGHVNFTFAFSFPHSLKIIMIYSEKKCTIDQLQQLTTLALNGARDVFDIVKKEINLSTRQKAIRFIE
jgi:exosome complex component RRP41